MSKKDMTYVRNFDTFKGSLLRILNVEMAYLLQHIKHKGNNMGRVNQHTNPSASTYGVMIFLGTQKCEYHEIKAYGPQEAMDLAVSKVNRFKVTRVRTEKITSAEQPSEMSASL